MKQHSMTFKTGHRIEQGVPYVMGILAAAGVFAAFRLYGEFCESLGIDAGIAHTLKTMKKATPDLHREFIEIVNEPAAVFYE